MKLLARIVFTGIFFYLFFSLCVLGSWSACVVPFHLQILNGLERFSSNFTATGSDAGHIIAIRDPIDGDYYSGQPTVKLKGLAETKNAG